MEDRGIHAYDLSSRVEAYDRDMQIMHPNREKMIQVALGFLPFLPTDNLRVLDLGVGTGLFTADLLIRHPRAEVVAVDGARTMVDLAEIRLSELASRVDFRIGDFRDLSALLLPNESFDAIISSFALHHLSKREKSAVVDSCVPLLRPGAWFVNADLVISEDPDLEERIQEIRVAGIVERAPEGDERFLSESSTRKYLDDLEEGEGDRPLTLAEDLACLREAGLESVSAIWVEFREAVTVSRKPHAPSGRRTRG